MALGRPLEGLAWGLAIGLVGSLASLLHVTEQVEEDVGLSWLFRLRGTIQAPEEVVVVAIDEPSAQRLGLSEEPRNWSRAIHAQLVDRLEQAGARLICFDLTFETPSQNQQNDDDLAAAIVRGGNVVLADRLITPAPIANQISGLEIVPPVPVLERASLAHAPFLVAKQTRVDSYWTFKSDAGGRPSLPVVALEIYAFDGYRHLLELLRRVAPDIRIRPPDTAAALVAFHGGVDTTDALRSAFIGHPHIGELVSEALDGTPDRELPPASKRLVRALLNLYRSGELTYLNFLGPARTFTTVPYDEALNPSAGAAKDRSVFDFKGKTVFVGFSAASAPEQDQVRDDYPTVFSQANGLNISGVEIAATAFANLLDDRPVRPVSLGWQLGIPLLLSTLLGVVCATLPPITAAAVVLALAAGYLSIALHQFSAAAFWLPLVVPLLLVTPLNLFRGALLHYRDAQRERNLIKEAVSRYLPPHVVDDFVKQVKPKTANQLVQGACLATDVVNYTPLAEAMDPMELAKLMNEYYAELFKPVERLGGFVSNLAGDSMIAIWAASSANASAGGQASLAALEIAEALHRFNEAVPGRPLLQTRLGVHSGNMLLGDIGASQHFQYEAMGDMITTATRIEGLSKHLGTQILASRAAVSDLQQVLMRPVGDFLLAGKLAPVSVVELLAHTQEATAQMALLCEKFAEALDAYRNRRWRSAASQFSEILTVFPEDGPSRFYLDRCEGYLLDPPAESWEPVVRLEQK